MAAVFFGIGAALVLDEFALILHLEDVYWSEDGRTSVDAVFVAVAIAGLLIMGFNPLAFFDINIWREDVSWQARAVVIGWAVLTLLLAMVVLLKGKLWTGLVGMGVPPLLVVGALRLSRPHAPWARWRYTPGRRRCTVRWSVNAGSGGRSCRPTWRCRACSPACPGSLTTMRWRPNWIAKSTPPPRRGNSKPQPTLDRVPTCGFSTTPSSSTTGGRSS